ncbi:MAG: acyl-CoA dehydrogenase family protein [Acidimicrobiales bacterium]
MLPDYRAHDGAIGLNWYELDPNLSFLLDRHLPDGTDRALAEAEVATYGRLVGETLAARAEETDKHGPYLSRYDRWGQERDLIVHHPTWTANKADLVRHGFVGARSAGAGATPGVVTAALAFLVCQAETAAYCALGMTAGAADMVERYAPASRRADLLEHLTSLDPERAWEGGMFLTERQGGSDVGANTTRAVRDGDEWLLSGDKHFCSNVDAQVFIVLARPEGSPPGTSGLATFIVPRHLDDGSPNGFVIQRLKPKLGTTGVPTAEVHLDNARGWLAAPEPGPAPYAAEGFAHGGEGSGGTETTSAAATAVLEGATVPGQGVKRMLEMVNTSRFGVALMGLGIHRRCFLEAAIYAAGRHQFGRRIDSFPMVRETLVDLLVELEAGMALTFECAAAARSSPDPDQTRLLRRVLVPLAKMRTTRTAVWAAGAALELLGGNGYMEDWPLARQLRDAHCHTIWEGTENIICLDVRRALRKEGAHTALFDRLERAVSTATHPLLATVADSVASALVDARAAVDHLASAPEDMAVLHARRLADLLADVAEGALLAEEAAWSLERDADARKAVVARRFASRHLSTAPLRGILSPDRTVLDLFEPIVRYGRVEADVLSLL